MIIMILLFILSSILLIISGIIDPGIMLKGNNNDIFDSKNEAKSKSIRIMRCLWAKQ